MNALRASSASICYAQINRFTYGGIGIFILSLVFLTRTSATKFPDIGFKWNRSFFRFSFVDELKIFQVQAQSRHIQGVSSVWNYIIEEHEQQRENAQGAVAKGWKKPAAKRHIRFFHAHSTGTRSSNSGLNRVMFREWNTLSISN